MIYLFAQLPTVPTTPGGDWKNPSNWSTFVATIGLPAFFALTFFAALSYVWWSSRRQPSNAKQLRALKQLFAEAVQRNARLRRVLRINSEVTLCLADVLGVIVDAVVNDVKAKSHAMDKLSRIRTTLDRLQDTLDAAPPPVPEELALEDDNEEDKSE